MSPEPSQAELGGFGRVLFHAREYWPDYMSCVVVVRQDVIDRRPQAVQILVDGIARSGLWLDEGRPHREHAADFVARYYYRQKPEVLRHALTEPLDLLIETGVLDKKIAFEEYVDPRFAEGATTQTAWKYEPGSGRAE